MKRLLPLATIALAAGPTTTPDAMADEPFPPASARCEILADEIADTDEDFRILVEFCEALGIEENDQIALDGLREPPDYFVKCEVTGDPDWIGFRLVTRSQCDQAHGVVKK